MKANRKALVVTTVASTIDQFCMNDISILLNDYDVQVAANFTTGNNTSEERIVEFKNELLNKNIIINEIEFTRNPLSNNNLVAFKKLKDLICQNNYDLIHCHTPIAALHTRLAANRLRKKGTKVIYTAHGFHFYRGAPFVNWLIYYPIERVLARYTDVLITINKEDFERAKSKLHAKNVKYIPGIGIDSEKFYTTEIDKDLKRNELALPKEAFVVLSVGELNKNKNHEVVIKAIAKINNPGIHYVICGQGQQEGHLRSLSKELSIGDRVHLLGFRKDIPEICKISDVFVLPSHREGLSVALMEAMSVGLPIIASRIRGNTDLIQDGNGGYLHDPEDHFGIAESINRIIANEKLRDEMGMRNKEEGKKYDKWVVKEQMRELYKNL
ncbi:MAG: glycosyltransferase family 4 protein [Bacillota bacterium]|nr:glycosyltransferase family 4 protein [Bacillota bacterium]